MDVGVLMFWFNLRINVEDPSERITPSVWFTFILIKLLYVVPNSSIMASSMDIAQCGNGVMRSKSLSTNC